MFIIERERANDLVSSSLLFFSLYNRHRKRSSLSTQDVIGVSIYSRLRESFVGETKKNLLYNIYYDSVACKSDRSFPFDTLITQSSLVAL